ncbi:MAG: protein kinase [Mobilitalea sp.]
MSESVEFLKEYLDREIYNSELPPVILHNYNVLACLKATAFKQVYLVCRKSDNKKCILKCIMAECQENLEDEFNLHSSLSNKGLTSAVEFIRTDKYSYFIREYVEGYTLTEYVEMVKDGHLTDVKTVEITLELCHILEYLHSMIPPVIHRDIKPDNIIITKEGGCKLIDFGISRRFSMEQEKDTIIMGTEYTSPPEQFGYMQTDARSDIYSLGVVIFYMATGNLNIKEINTYVLTANIKKCIAKCTEFSPADRYDTVSKLEKKLKKTTLDNRKRAKLRIAVIIFVAFIVLCNYKYIFADSGKIGQLNQTNLSQNELVQQEDKEDKEDDNTPIIFTSSLIEDAVRHELGKTKGDIITKKELQSITELYICGEQVYSTWKEHFVYGANQYMNIDEFSQSGIYNNNGNITSIKDLSYMDNLCTLALYNQNISDLSPLSDLSDLTYLGLGCNNINDISDLSGLVRLKTLDISGNPISNSDIIHINKFNDLENLDIGATQITELTALKGMKLQSLSLFDTKVSDCEGIDSLVSLEHLIVTGVNNSITQKGLERILELPNLRELRLMGGDLYDVSVLNKSTKLTYLDLCASKMENMNQLEGLNLDTLYIDYTTISDISFLEKFPNLLWLGIVDIPCEDFSVLAKMPNLQGVSCNEKTAEMIKERLQEVPFTITIR